MSDSVKKVSLLVTAAQCDALNAWADQPPWLMKTQHGTDRQDRVRIVLHVTPEHERVLDEFDAAAGRHGAWLQRSDDSGPHCADEVREHEASVARMTCGWPHNLLHIPDADLATFGESSLSRTAAANRDALGVGVDQLAGMGCIVVAPA